MKKFVALALAFWLSTVALSFWWERRDDAKEETRLAMETSRALMTQVTITREWNALHGGVYALVTAENQPNAFLDDPERDIKLADGRMLTKINPAYMTRQLADLSERETSFHLRITSSNPLRPANAPTSWEAEALKKLALGEREVSEYVEDDGKRKFIYMAPLVATRNCLRCHAKQGVREGDLRGGISIEINDPPTLPLTGDLLWHAFFALTGTLFIILVGRKLEEAYDVCRFEATIDPLTRIPNRRFFMERFHHELRVAHRQELSFGLLMVDVDHFKLFNDAYGHIEGDRCLVAVADAIRASLQRPSDLCARFGGEEFVAMMPDTTGHGALYVAERVRTAVESLNIEHRTSPTAPRVTVSVGVALLERGMASPDIDLKFISMADEALYEAKNGGRNRVVVHSF